ncbi:adenylate/guanylate cyclase domain-containing protein [Lichenifustis flavocetrariae]|uniref:Adenylate/guanylate cyclase domain-containing protein n=1 Tax=Lichenifustis flavocetrariae TaxID=2949735 RepID=A0AA42CI80_9HYPH|nr:adenylate/guanylate cyclase domain-containing protein [Lichenifustis flavocetrariae]MCW6508074.1 adenylate/guanylate cyclase domain-containing protein [Lichenifustis flavocetrariae]
MSKEISDTAELARWITQSATASDDGESLLKNYSLALVAAGIPVWRLGVSMPALDPTASSFSLIWTSDEGVVLSQTPHGEENEVAFRQSPIQSLLEKSEVFGRWRLDALGVGDPFPVLHEFKSAGGTDYVLYLVAFTPGTALRGVAISFVTREPTGFSASQMAALADLIPALGLAMCKLAFSHTLRHTLGTYLGAATGTHVLGGQIRRGEGRTIWAAILLTDLRGFTALADRQDPTEVVGWLDEHFEAVGEPIAASGGEILKFMGDGFLAVFPVSAPEIHPCIDCESALQAAVAARAANRRLNEMRRARHLPALEVDIVLHFGEVVYGNVGTDRRLDFTVIGRAVNEASRIEKLCGDLDRSILISDSFANRCRYALDAVGSVSLRGLEHSQRVWTLPDGNMPLAHSTA